MNHQRIYLDHAATTPLRAEVARAMDEVCADANYNPSSLHAEGRRARALLDDAREHIASLLGAARNEIVFTSGGTESDNLAILGAAHAMRPLAQIVVSAIEHHAVLGAAERLHDEGFETTKLPVGADGRVDLGTFEEALTPRTTLASVAYANNEVGTIQPIEALAAIAHSRGALFHTDAVQAPAWLPIDVVRLGVDMLSLSAHKLGGPRGVGLLYVRKGTPIEPPLRGGGQELGRRPGTQDVLGIVGFARALELATAERKEAYERVAALRDRLEAAILASVEGAYVNGGRQRLPNNLHVSFAQVDAAALLIGLDLGGIAVSGGSACTSGSLEPSHVLAALKPDQAWRTSGIRFSLGLPTTVAEIDRVAEALPALIADLRRPARIGRGDG